jgi:hypothetical protein
MVEKLRRNKVPHAPSSSTHVCEPGFSPLELRLRIVCRGLPLCGRSALLHGVANSQFIKGDVGKTIAGRSALCSESTRCLAGLNSNAFAKLEFGKWVRIGTGAE